MKRGITSYQMIIALILGLLLILFGPLLWGRTAEGADNITNGIRCRIVPQLCQGDSEDTNGHSKVSFETTYGGALTDDSKITQTTLDGFGEAMNIIDNIKCMNYEKIEGANVYLLRSKLQDTYYILHIENENNYFALVNNQENYQQFVRKVLEEGYDSQNLLRIQLPGDSEHSTMYYEESEGDSITLGEVMGPCNEGNNDNQLCNKLKSAEKNCG